MSQDPPISQLVPLESGKTSLFSPIKPGHIHQDGIACACGHDHSAEEGHSHSGVGLDFQLTVLLPLSIAALTLAGAFADAARRNVATGGKNVSKVNVTTDVNAIEPGSQDAVVMNMILGCVATQENHGNVTDVQAVTLVVPVRA